MYHTIRFMRLAYLGLVANADDEPDGPKAVVRKLLGRGEHSILKCADEGKLCPFEVEALMMCNEESKRKSRVVYQRVLRFFDRYALSPLFAATSPGTMNWPDYRHFAKYQLGICNAWKARGFLEQARNQLTKASHAATLLDFVQEHEEDAADVEEDLRTIEEIYARMVKNATSPKKPTLPKPNPRMGDLAAGTPEAQWRDVDVFVYSETIRTQMSIVENGHAPGEPAVICMHAELEPRTCTQDFH